MMRIGGFQKLTLLDYPGQVACIAFTTGCNFRCPFCHNSGLVVPDRYGKPEPVDGIFSYLSTRSGLLDGVVVTGGEPLIHRDLPDFLRRIRELGYKVKLDTNGSLPERLKEVIQTGLVDYVAMDIKHSQEKYPMASGIDSPMPATAVNECLRILRESGIPYELRTTLVKGIHTIQDAEDIARWIKGDEPYYLQNYVDSGNVIEPSDLHSFSEDEMIEIYNKVRSYCPYTQIRT